MGRYRIGQREAAVKIFSGTAEAAIDALGGKWKIVILWLLEEKPRRFNELRRLLHGISQKVLTDQLRQLESDGLIVREQFEEIPPRVIYTLTDYGRSAHDVIEALCAWGERHCEKIGAYADWQK